jgi:hypothetical protein
VLEQRLRVGINGYYLKQTTDAKFNDVSIPGTREQVLGIGPGFVYTFSKKTSLFFNAYIETEARDRAEGTTLTLRYATKF